ncbi:MAG: L,D-transpeptidase family protein [Proteobacteria bacterium]|nr:L,D-transpeptidase family protein [Pseudomonadota bacterium]
MMRVPLFIAVLAFCAPLLGASPSRADEPLWTGSRVAEARTQTLLKTLRAAGDHGLDPAWYGVEQIEQALKSSADAARTDQMIGEAFAAYASDVSTGRINANSIDPDISIEQRKVKREDLFKAAAETPDFGAWLANLPPKGDYPALQKALATWREKRAASRYTPMPTGDALKPGMTDPRVPVLRTRLAELELTVPPPAGLPENYDDALVMVVRAYQQTKGLTVDGVIGANTIRSLNTSLDDRIQQIVANLERRRWLPQDLGQRYVFVNTGDYSMVFVNAGEPVFQGQVIVGTPKHPTPEIQSTMYGFQTNPYWTVPQSIAGDEYLPLLRRDPYALANQGFKIFASWSDNDSEVDPGAIDWSTVNPKAFPYRVRQEPGATNALGYIFFPFQNKYGIYMHDTATRWLFTEGSRNFSHGCIRLQNPLDFVEKVFGGRGNFDKGRVQKAIDDGDQVHYSFPESVKLYVTYRTVTAASDGTPTFRDDVYGRDRKVVAAMGRPRS